MIPSIRGGPPDAFADLNQHRTQLVAVGHRLNPRAMKHHAVDVAALQATVFGASRKVLDGSNLKAATLQLRLIVGDELRRSLGGGRL